MKTFEEITKFVNSLPNPPRTGKQGRPTIPWQKRFWRKVKKQGDHWLFVASRGQRIRTHLHGVSDSPRQAIFDLCGLKSIAHYVTSKCVYKNCVNPSHLEASSDPERNAEIARRWKKHLDNLESMVGLAKEFGITKQRVEQIVRDAGLPYKQNKT